MKTRHMIACIIMCPGVPMLASCQNSPDPQSILRNAIEAHGGEENIKKPRMGILKGTSDSDGVKVEQEEIFDLPRRWKRTTKATINGEKKVGFNLMLDGVLWEWDDGGHARRAAKEKRAEPYFGLLTLLFDLSKENVRLSPLKKKKVNDRSAVGFRAIWDGGAGEYYCDATSGFLVETSFKWQPEPGKEFETRVIFNDVKDVDGVKLPYRRVSYIKSGGAAEFVLLDDYIVTQVTILKTIGDNIFSLPGNK